MTEIATVRPAKKKDADVIVQFGLVHQFEYDILPFEPVKNILNKNLVKKKDIRACKDEIAGNASGYFLETIQADSIQNIQGVKKFYRLEDEAKNNVVGILRYNKGSLQKYGTTISVQSLNALCDERDEKQRDARKVALLDGFLNNDITQDVDTLSIAYLWPSDEFMAKICGDKGRLETAKYRAFKGKEQIQELREIVGAYKEKLVL